MYERIKKILTQIKIDAKKYYSINTEMLYS